MASTTDVIISDGIFGWPAGAISSSVCASCSHDFFDFAETDIDNRRSLHEETSPRSVNELSQVRQRFSAVRLPMPGSNFTMRLNATSSRGLDTKRMNEVTSLICACSKNLMPLVICSGHQR